MNIKKLSMALKELEDFLQSCGVIKYASLLASYRGILDQYINNPSEYPFPLETISNLRKHAFGGMGSLNDLWLCKENGHIVDDESSANEKLDELRERLKDALRT